MHDPNSLPPGGIREPKKALLERLNERVTHIADNWYTLAQVDWDPDKLNRLHRHIKDLGDDCAKFGLAQVNDGLSSLDICLTPYLDSDLRPSPQKIDEVFTRIRALKSAADITVRTETKAIENDNAPGTSPEIQDIAEVTQDEQSTASDRQTLAPESRLVARAQFVEHLNELISSDEPKLGGVLVVQLDHLKRQDRGSLGDKADALLREAADLIATKIVSQDMASQISERACAVIAKRPTSEGVLALAEKLRRTIEANLFRFQGESFNVTASIGICEIEQDIPATDGILTAAADACEAARAAGGNRIKIHASNTPSSVSGEHDERVQDLLRQALQQDAFQIWLQARVNLRTGAREAYEVAPLLPTPGGDPIPRSKFLSYVPSAKLLDQVDRWVFEYALGVMDKRRRQGGEDRLLIKQGARALVDGNRIEWLRERLRARQLVGTGLSLEFDLADLIAAPQARTLYSEIMSSTGVSLSLTGFDADAAAFEALKQLPVQFVQLHERIKTLRPETMDSVVDEVEALGVKVIAAENDQQ